MSKQGVGEEAFAKDGLGSIGTFNLRRMGRSILFRRHFRGETSVWDQVLSDSLGG
jgi:hypothetical protein